MIKRVTLVLFVFVLLISNVGVFAEGGGFPDLDEAHWAYKYVSALVNDGTVKGNENGYFEPNKMVSRAEFVKMIGKGPTTRNNDFADVPSDHWGYDYIMTSGVVSDANNNFNPAAPMTRGQTIEILWARAGKPSGIIAPNIILKQAENRDSISWIYMYGVMVGSDGVNLRLDDPISRAETAAIIIKARDIKADSKQINFVDIVSPKLLEAVYKSINLFDFPYEPKKTITNGEMARATVRLASEEFDLTYRKFPTESPFENIYAKDLAIVGNCIGKDKVNTNFVEQKANNLDTLAAFAYAAILKSHTTVSYGNANNFYKDAPAMEKVLANTILTFAYESGIQLYAKGEILPSQSVTLKNVAAILLQLDDKVGLQSVITTDVDAQSNNVSYDVKLSKNIDAYPQDWSNFACILATVPAEVYSNNFENMTTLDGSYGKNPASTYNFAREYSGLFTDMLKQYKIYLNKKQGIDVRFTYIPSLVCDNQSGYTVRVKCEVVNLNGKGLNYKDVFDTLGTSDANEKLYDGMTFYADACTDYTMGTGEAGDFAFGKLIFKVK